MRYRIYYEHFTNILNPYVYTYNIILWVITKLYLYFVTLIGHILIIQIYYWKLRISTYYLSRDNLTDSITHVIT